MQSYIYPAGKFKCNQRTANIRNIGSNSTVFGPLSIEIPYTTPYLSLLHIVEISSQSWKMTLIWGIVLSVWKTCRSWLHQHVLFGIRGICAFIFYGIHSSDNQKQAQSLGSQRGSQATGHLGWHASGSTWTANLVLVHIAPENNDVQSSLHQKSAILRELKLLNVIYMQPNVHPLRTKVAVLRLISPSSLLLESASKHEVRKGCNRFLSCARTF